MGAAKGNANRLAANHIPCMDVHPCYATANPCQLGSELGCLEGRLNR